MREKPYYRDVLADLIERTNGKMILNIKDTKELLGTSRDKAEEILGRNVRTITVQQLASRLLG